MRPSHHPRGTRRVVAAVAALGLLACTELTSLDQENLGELSASTLYVPGNAALLTNGAVSDFECAFARYVVGSGLFADELTVAISQAANAAGYSLVLLGEGMCSAAINLGPELQPAQLFEEARTRFTKAIDAATAAPAADAPAAQALNLARLGRARAALDIGGAANLAAAAADAALI